MLGAVSATYLPTQRLVVEIIIRAFLKDVRYNWRFLRAVAARVPFDV